MRINLSNITRFAIDAWGTITCIIKLFPGTVGVFPGWAVFVCVLSTPPGSTCSLWFSSTAAWAPGFSPTVSVDRWFACRLSSSHHQIHTNNHPRNKTKQSVSYYQRPINHIYRSVLLFIIYAPGALHYFYPLYAGIENGRFENVVSLQVLNNVNFWLYF